MVKLNEEIIGGLISALSRKESLEKAMLTFYNAGYEKDEIEDSAKDVYTKLGSDAMGVKGSLQVVLDDIASRAGVLKKEKPKEEEKESDKEGSILNDKLVLQPIPEKKDVEAEIPKKENKSNQVVSVYGSGDDYSQYKNSNDITSRIEEAIKGLRPVNIPSKIEIVHKNEDSSSQTIVQHVSSYEDAPRTASKAMTFVLIFILIILLGALVAVFLFKDDLIKLFNDLGLG
jgi:hypothetical protein